MPKQTDIFMGRPLFNISFSLHISHGCTLGVTFSVCVPACFREEVVTAHLTLLSLLGSLSVLLTDFSLHPSRLWQQH